MHAEMEWKTCSTEYKSEMETRREIPHVDTRILLNLSSGFLCSILSIYTWFTSVPSFLLKDVRHDIVFLALMSLIWALLYLYYDLRTRERMFILTPVPGQNTIQATKVHEWDLSLKTHCKKKTKPFTLKLSENQYRLLPQLTQSRGSVDIIAFICHIILICLNINHMETLLRNLLLPIIPFNDAIPYHLLLPEKILILILPICVIVVNVSTAVVHILGSIINRSEQNKEQAFYSTIPSADSGASNAINTNQNGGNGNHRHQDLVNV